MLILEFTNINRGQLHFKILVHSETCSVEVSAFGFLQWATIKQLAPLKSVLGSSCSACLSPKLCH